MTPQEKLAAMLTAMMGEDDDWRDEMAGWDKLSDEALATVEEDDWKRYDTTDYEAGAAYWDEIAIEQGGGI